jgi:nicotinamidase-related amidase
VQRTGASRFAQGQIERHRRLAPVADLDRWQKKKAHTMKKALLLIDLQNDYFPGGLFPLWNARETLATIKDAVARARAAGILVVHIQHLADPDAGIAPFFNAGTEGAMIHSEILAAAPEAPVVIKHFADSFFKTDLENVLSAHGVGELLVCGMMTQNCVTHTAISKSAEKYKVSIVTDCCTTVSELIHLIALHAVSTRMTLTTSRDAI